MIASSPSEQFIVDVQHLTAGIAALLAEHPAQADVINRLGEIARTRPDEIASAYCDGAIWGGSGSVCDVQLADRPANATLCRQLVSLVHRFEREGYACESASQTAAIYRGWLKSGVLVREPVERSATALPRRFEVIRRRLGLVPPS